MNGKMIDRGLEAPWTLHIGVELDFDRARGIDHRVAGAGGGAGLAPVDQVDAGDLADRAIQRNHRPAEAEHQQRDQQQLAQQRPIAGANVVRAVRAGRRMNFRGFHHSRRQPAQCQQQVI